MNGGTLIGVGVGPGDPRLVTVRAAELIGSAGVIAYHSEAGNASNARAIIAAHLNGAEELTLLYPVTTEIPRTVAAYRDALRAFYDEAAQTIAARLDEGRTVAVIAEGDPLFYGSYMHLHVRLSARYQTEIVAGVTGMSGCWSEAGAPIAQGDDVFVVVPATLPEPDLARRFADADAAVVMKIGRHLGKVRRALDRSGRLSRAIYVERGTTDRAVAMPLASKRDDEAPYFSVVLVPGWEARS